MLLFLNDLGRTVSVSSPVNISANPQICPRLCKTRHIIWHHIVTAKLPFLLSNQNPHPNSVITLISEHICSGLNCHSFNIIIDSAYYTSAHPRRGNASTTSWSFFPFFSLKSSFLSVSLVFILHRLKIPLRQICDLGMYKQNWQDLRRYKIKKTKTTQKTSEQEEWMWSHGLKLRMSIS